MMTKSGKIGKTKTGKKIEKGSKVEETEIRLEMCSHL